MPRGTRYTRIRMATKNVSNMGLFILEVHETIILCSVCSTQVGIGFAIDVPTCLYSSDDGVLKTSRHK
jgi:hypothetical protein